MALKGKAAERAAESAALARGWVKPYRPLDNRYHDTDVFNSFDLLALCPDRGLLMAQVTGSDDPETRAELVRRRRRKIEELPLPTRLLGTDLHVLVMEARSQRRPHDRRFVDHWFRIHRYVPDGWAVDDEPWEVPRA